MSMPHAAQPPIKPTNIVKTTDAYSLADLNFYSFCMKSHLLTHPGTKCLILFKKYYSSNVDNILVMMKLDSGNILMGRCLAVTV